MARVHEIHKKVENKNKFNFEVTFLKFGDLLGLEVGIKCKISAQYLQNYVC